MGGGSSGSSIILLVLLIAGFVIFFMYRKSKKDKENKVNISNRRNKDEVWRTIKQYLKETGQYGVEIVDSYVIKRQDENFVSPYLSKEQKKAKKAEIDARRKENKINKVKKPVEAPRQVYVVVYQTKNTKTGVFNPLDCFECEVVKHQISKKQFESKIIINGHCNFEKEMKWIGPIREAETKKNLKMAEAQKKMDDKARAKYEKKRAKEAKKNKK